jgi:hypothetical protein
MRTARRQNSTRGIRCRLLERNSPVAEVLAGLVFVECAVLALNRGPCPLTDLASRYTDDRAAANFDIHLPEWLARRHSV